MSTTPEHCKDCLEAFGEEFRPFHDLIDCYYNHKGRDSEGAFDYTVDKVNNSGRENWHKERIHTTGFIDLIREMYGDRPAEALLFHLKQDFKGTDWEHFPPCKADYIKGWLYDLKRQIRYNAIQ